MASKLMTYFHGPGSEKNPGYKWMWRIVFHPDERDLKREICLLSGEEDTQAEMYRATARELLLLECDAENIGAQLRKKATMAAQ